MTWLHHPRKKWTLSMRIYSVSVAREVSQHHYQLHKRSPSMYSACFDKCSSESVCTIPVTSRVSIGVILKNCVWKASWKQLNSKKRPQFCEKKLLRSFEVALPFWRSVNALDGRWRHLCRVISDVVNMTTQRRQRRRRSSSCSRCRRLPRLSRIFPQCTKTCR